MIPRSVRLAEAPSFGKTILEYEANGVAAKAYRQLAEEFIRRQRGEAIPEAAARPGTRTETPAQANGPDPAFSAWSDARRFGLRARPRLRYFPDLDHRRSLVPSSFHQFVRALSCWRATGAGCSRWRWRTARSAGSRPTRAASFRWSTEGFHMPHGLRRTF